MKRLISLVSALALLFVLSSCASSGAYVAVYRSIAPYYRISGEIVRQESVQVNPGTDLPLSIIDAFNSYPSAKELENPLPSNCSILHYERHGDCIRLEVTQEYAGLTGAKKIVADACIALTFCKLEGINAIEVYSGGRRLTARLSAKEIIFED